MGFFHLTLLAIIQGLTEFIPVSSSAHLAIFPLFFQLERQSIGIDIAVHIGSLIAVCQIFRQHIAKLFLGLFGLIFEKGGSAESKFFIYIFMATVPIVIVTIFLTAFDLMNHLRNIYLIAIASILFSVPLFVADKRASKKRSIEELTFLDSIYIGFWQSFAIIPGASRSGCCITGSLIRGFRSVDAAQISLIMSVPTIIGSGVLLMFEIFSSSESDFFDQRLNDVACCIIFSYLSAFLSIKILFRLIEKMSFLPFVLYRILFGLGVLTFLFLA